MAISAFYDSDNNISVYLTDLNGDPLEGATVEVTVYDEDGTESAGHTWPLSVPEDGGGLYVTKLNYTVFADLYERKKAKVVATSGGNRRAARITLEVAPDDD